MKKKNYLIITVFMITTLLLGGCTGSNDSGQFDTDRTINVVSREDGSGTRGAFIELVGILEDDASGNETDRTYEEAIIQNGTDAVMTTVAGDKYAIGYISIGSLNDTINSVKIDGIEATSDNVQNGSYKIARPFNVAYNNELSILAQDFMEFIRSADGQAIVVEEGYVQVSSDLKAYAGTTQKGKLVVAGSTSVSPVMEKLAEVYESIHPEVTIEIQSTGSSAGMQSAIEGTADLGMASRKLKDSELAELTAEVIALDGIAIIVNKENITGNLTIDQIKSIYIGEMTKWKNIEKSID